MTMHKIYEKGELREVDCVLYEPFPSKKGFTFIIPLTTNGGGKRTVEANGSSIQDAIDYVKSLYHGCTIDEENIKAK